MKKALLWAIPGLTLLGCVFLVKNIYRLITLKERAEMNIQIPHFAFYTLNNKLYSDSNIADYKGKTIFNYFHPECNHCQYMAQSFRRNAGIVQGARIIMVTSADNADIQQFIESQQLSGLKNIIVLKDTKFRFPKTFGTSVVPSFFIYENNRLVKKIIGETKFENLIGK